MIETLIVQKRFAGERHDIRDFVTPHTFEVMEPEITPSRSSPSDVRDIYRGIEMEDELEEE